MKSESNSNRELTMKKPKRMPALSSRRKILLHR